MRRRVVSGMRLRLAVPFACVALLASACGTATGSSGTSASGSASASASASAAASGSTATATPSALPGAVVSPAATAATTGIDVHTIAGPTCPAQRDGQSCTTPISATVVITHQDGSSAAQVQTGADGTAHVPLPPGAYTVTGQSSGNRYPRAPAPQHATVTAGSFVSVELAYDTGIR
jgi:hypothetical protein